MHSLRHPCCRSGASCPKRFVRLIDSAEGCIQQSAASGGHLRTTILSRPTELGSLLCSGFEPIPRLHIDLECTRRVHMADLGIDPSVVRRGIILDFLTHLEDRRNLPGLPEQHAPELFETDQPAAVVVHLAHEIICCGRRPHHLPHLGLVQHFLQLLSAETATAVLIYLGKEAPEKIVSLRMLCGEHLPHEFGVGYLPVISHPGPNKVLDRR
mmetsp:Transcript_83486/g.185386  ORF Transcript_83486/g.185386 Transcript_83486/m.185386 type:complete len:212 (+) Transcript_83486:45-680(+)